MPVDQRRREVAGEPGELGRVRHPDADRLAVAPAVALDLLDRVPEGVPVVEDLPQLDLAQVGGDDVGLDPDGPLDELAQERPVDVDRRHRVGLDQLEDARVGDEPALDDLGHARPRGRAAAGWRARRGRRARPPAGGTTPTRFLPSAVLIPVFPPTAASTIASSVVGTWTTRTPRSHVAATKPARSVTVPPPTPTTASVRVNPAWPSAPQSSAATAALLASSASGTSARYASRPAARAASATALRPDRERRRVDDEDALDARRPAGARPRRATPWPTTTS